MKFLSDILHLSNAVAYFHSTNFPVQIWTSVIPQASILTE